MQAGDFDSYWRFPPVAADVIAAVEEEDRIMRDNPMQ